jgi:hypothetical protein
VFASTDGTVSSKASVEPPLNPNQPNHRTSVPNIAIGRFDGLMGTGVPSAANRPSRGPTTMAAASAAQPPTECTTVDPGEIDEAATRQPPVTVPDPVAEHRVDERHDRDHPEVRAEVHALCDRTGDDRHRRAGEDRLEEKKDRELRDP